MTNLRIAVTGEAHVYEDVLGYNAACMFRCLDEAIIEAGNRHFIRHIAAMATIRSLENHMQDLSGRAFRRVDLEGNGASRYPAKALANEQFPSGSRLSTPPTWTRIRCSRSPETRPIRHRERLLQRASAALVAPDVGHAWLGPAVRGPVQQRFLANLRIAVTGEAHVYEDVLGTNAACMFRCLNEAIIEAGNRYFIQRIAATATIRSPEKQMQDLGGRAFRRVGLEGNGAPTHSIRLLRGPYSRRRKHPSSPPPVS